MQIFRIEMKTSELQKKQKKHKKKYTIKQQKKIECLASRDIRVVAMAHSEKVEYRTS